MDSNTDTARRDTGELTGKINEAISSARQAAMAVTAAPA
jgi:hypothetical protein